MTETDGLGLTHEQCGGNGDNCINSGKIDLCCRSQGGKLCVRPYLKESRLIIDSTWSFLLKVDLM